MISSAQRIVFTLVLSVAGAFGSSLPLEERIFTSSDARFLFHVVPRIEESRRSVPRFQPKDGLPSTWGAFDFCYGTLFRFEYGSYHPVWRGKLQNRLAPLFVVISPDGSALVTIGGVGDDDSVIGVYGSDGTMLKGVRVDEFYSADDLTAITAARKTWWGKSHIDPGKHLFIMELFGGRLLRIDTRTGSIVKATE